MYLRYEEDFSNSQLLIPSTGENTLYNELVSIVDEFKPYFEKPPYFNKDIWRERKKGFDTLKAAVTVAGESDKLPLLRKIAGQDDKIHLSYFSNWNSLPGKIKDLLYKYYYAEEVKNNVAANSNFQDLHENVNHYVEQCVRKEQIILRLENENNELSESSKAQADASGKYAKQNQKLIAKLSAQSEKVTNTTTRNKRLLDENKLLKLRVENLLNENENLLSMVSIKDNEISKLKTKDQKQGDDYNRLLTENNSLKQTLSQVDSLLRSKSKDLSSLKSNIHNVKKTINEHTLEIKKFCAASKEIEGYVSQLKTILDAIDDLDNNVKTFEHTKNTFF